MRPKTTYESGRLFCEMVATLIAHRIPTLATVTRTVDERGRTVYIDYLQNLHGKTLASVYSARVSEFAGVSTPIQWSELEQGIRPQDCTLRTVFRTVLRRLAQTRSMGSVPQSARRGPRGSAGPASPIGRQADALNPVEEATMDILSDTPGFIIPKVEHGTDW